MECERVYRTCAVALAVCLGLLVSPAVGTRPTDDLTENEATASDLVRAALESEVSAGPASRESLLQQALDLAPDYPPARWHAGYISFDGKWLSPDEIQEQVKDDGRWAEHRRLRHAYGGTPGGELSLARWCRKKGLDEEAKYHWLVVVQFQPQNKEALSALGMRWDHGKLRTHAEIAQGKRKRTEGPKDHREVSRGLKHWEEHWTATLTKWQRTSKLGDADLQPSIRDELQTIEDPVALNVLQALLQKPRRSKKEQEFQKTLSLELVRFFDSRPGDRNAGRLVRFAVDHPNAEVCKAAADGLANRPMESYVPMLLGRMKSPLEADFMVYTYPDGGVSYQHTFYREGLDADFSETRNESTYLPSDALIVSPSNPVRNHFCESAGSVPLSSVVEARSRAVGKALRARAGAIAQATQIQNRVRNANAAVIHTNRRIQAVLTHATGVDRGANPTDWQKWWRDRSYDHFELEDARYGYASDYPPVKPVYEKRSFASGHDYIRRTSCFPQGTRVWTLLGPAPIEEIRPGDRVLSQDPESGELAYRTVLKTTTRNPTELVDLGLGSETITSTRGHPFWVEGEGWRMAKQIEVGMPLHGFSGVVPVDHVAELPAPKPWYEFAYNLVVDDFHTYFVGASRLLVHDNTPFPSGKSLPLVPGLTQP